MTSFTASEKPLNLDWQHTPQPLHSMTLSQLTSYAALAKQSWSEYKAVLYQQNHHSSTSSSSLRHKTTFSYTSATNLLPGESWLSDSIQVVNIADNNQGVFATSHLSLGTVLVRSKGVTRDTPSSYPHVLGIDTIDFYTELVAIVANGDNFATKLLERIEQLCPTSKEECDQIAAADPLLGDTEFQGNLFAILDQKGARSELITNEWLLRCAVKCDRNCFFEGLFPTAAKFNHSCHPNCVTYFDNNTQTMVVRTISYVSAGSELNILYLGERQMYMPTDQRRSILHKKYGFICNCSRCDPLITASELGISKLTLLKRQRSERLLEAMKCPMCEKNETSICIPVDDHRNNGVAPLAGWHVCATCGKKSEINLDNVLIGKYKSDAVIRKM